MLEFQERHGSEVGCIEALARLRPPLNGTIRGIGAKHPLRYAREGSYPFNRRTCIAELSDIVLRRAMARPTVTYSEPVNGLQPRGALPALTG